MFSEMQVIGQVDRDSCNNDDNDDMLHYLYTV